MGKESAVATKKPTVLGMRSRNGIRLLSILRQDNIELSARKSWMFWGTSTLKKSRIYKNGLYERDGVRSLKTALLQAEEVALTGGKPLLFVWEETHSASVIPPESLYEIPVDRIRRFFSNCSDCPIETGESVEYCDMFCTRQQFRSSSDREQPYRQKYWEGNI